MRRTDFESGNITANIFRQALPLLFAQVLNLLYNIVDRIYISRIPGSGTAALGAVGLCFPLIVAVSAFASLFGNGAAPLFAIALGRGDKKEASFLMSTSFSLLTIASVILLTAGEFFSRPLLTSFGASGSAMGFALPYLRIYLLGTFFAMTATGMNQFINAQGYPSVGMFTVLIGAVTNIVLDPLFIFVLGLGVRGAAIATVLSQILSSFFALRFLFHIENGIPLRILPPSALRTSGRRILDIVGLGSVSFVMQITNGIVTAVCNSVLMGNGGDLYVSVMTIVSSVRQILDTPTLAFTDGASPVISFNYGARRPEQIRKAIRIMAVVSISYTAIVWSMILLLPRFFIGIFSTDETIMADAVPALHLYFFAFVFQALQYSGQTVFKSLGKKRHALFFSIFRKVVMVVPLTLLLPRLFGLGTDGVFMAEPISNVIGGTACFVTMLVTVLPELRGMEAGVE